MVAVPAHAAADMKQHLIEELQHGGNLRADDLGRMKMSRVQRIEHLPANGIPKRILVACDRVALHAEAEELALHRGKNRMFVIGSGEDFIQRTGHDLAVPNRIRTGVFVAVRHPEIHRAGLSRARRKRARNLKAALAVLHPETALFLIKAAQGKIPVHHGVRKIGRVKV
ncbi:hypothetical protein SDC9_204875 [bioreactor metagenome]|uniref:Uncharacterized protein n=1 Tax=bioreactor metagenome TaxID=1076179 RepID=A0A645J0R8_9ZZZZ